MSISTQLDRPIIVVGSPRSGTTLLGDLLQAHPALAYAPEPRLVWRYGNDGLSDALRPEDARPEVCRHIREHFARLIEQAGRERLLEKTPSNALRLGFVDRVLPGCKVVHILRHGVPSVLSIRQYWEQYAGVRVQGRIGRRWKELDWRRARHYAKEAMQVLLPRKLARLAGRPVWGPRIPGIDGLLRDLDLLDVCCLQWRMCVEAACAYGRTLPDARYMECRLEDMSPDLLRDVLDFAELKDAPEMWEHFEKRFDPTQPANRIADADPKDIDRILAWTEPTLKWLGYE
jgi:Sulfotransferase family